MATIISLTNAPWTAVFLVICLGALAATSPVVFEDSYRSVQGSDGGGGGNSGASRLQFPTDAAEPEGRVHKRRKKKKVICGIANLIAGRDAGAGVDSANLGREHRAVRAVGSQQPQDPQQSGRHLGVAGFLLGTVVGSQLASGGFGFTQSQSQTPTQTQTQTQVQSPVAPAPVSEDYDDVADVYSGGGGGSICDQLQQQPEPGPFDSHFPLIHGLLSGVGGGGGQRPYRPPPRPLPPRPVAYNQGGGVFYQYFKPWVGLFFR